MIFLGIQRLKFLLHMVEPFRVQEALYRGIPVVGIPQFFLPV